MKLSRITLAVVAVALFCIKGAHADEPDIGQSNWKICKNETLNFEVSYPPDWSVYFPSDSEGAADRPPIKIRSCEQANEKLGVALGPENTNEPIGFGINVCNSHCMKSPVYAGVTNLDDFLLKQPSSIKNDDVVSRTIVDGEEAAILKGAGIFVLHGGQSYNLICGSRTPEALCSAILKTFRFLRPAKRK